MKGKPGKKKLGVLTLAVVAAGFGYSDLSAASNIGERQQVTTQKNESEAAALKCMSASEMSVSEFNQAVARQGSLDEKLFVLGINQDGRLLVGMEDKRGQVSVEQTTSLKPCETSMAW